MAYEQKEGGGSLFKNERKEKDSHPNLQGSALIGGVEYWVSGWTKTRDNGDKWISLAFKPKEARSGGHQDEPKAKPAAKKDPFDEMDSDLPF